MYKEVILKIKRKSEKELFQLILKFGDFKRLNNVSEIYEKVMNFRSFRFR